MMQGGNVLPMFRSYADLEREQAEILERFTAEWEAAYRLWDAVVAVLKNDQGELSKFASGDVDLAKSFVVQHGDDAKWKIECVTASTLLAAAKRRNEGIFGIGEMAKRSQRFANAVSRRYHGPASDFISMERRR